MINYTNFKTLIGNEDFNFTGLTTGRIHIMTYKESLIVKDKKKHRESDFTINNKTDFIDSNISDIFIKKNKSKIIFDTSFIQGKHKTKGLTHKMIFNN